MNRSADTVVIGLGNVILSDDGLGVHAVRRLRERDALGAHIELVEGGTAGLLLLPYLEDARRAILVDAIDTGSPPGTLTQLNAADWTNTCSTVMTPHDVALNDLLAAARLTGHWPEELALLGAQPAWLTLGTSLSPPVEAALDPLIDAIMAQLSAWAVVVGEPCA